MHIKFHIIKTNIIFKLSSPIIISSKTKSNTSKQYKKRLIHGPNLALLEIKSPGKPPVTPLRQIKRNPSSSYLKEMEVCRTNRILRTADFSLCTAEIALGVWTQKGLPSPIRLCQPLDQALKWLTAGGGMVVVD
ncbi:hypothetical protein CEXT_418731 [Caerostris extrusa]|uniref:Uncharacterized protein n=1 Tax=Caerostris extrusa TaxID=172846 RepID=A0AAV4TE79_CAEEX|nr:hypothetical protein CEXT_418731 [Caerostris extrusa]